MLLGERIRPPQSREPCEVPVGSVQNAAMFDRQRRELRITYQRPTRLALRNHLTEQAPVMFARDQQAHVGLVQQLVEDLRGFASSARLKGPFSRRDQPPLDDWLVSHPKTALAYERRGGRRKAPEALCNGK